MNIIGWIGAFLLLGAWIPETLTTLKSESLEAMNPEFILLSLGGSITLAVHSYQISDLSFLFLNISLSVLIFAEVLVYIYKVRS
ncbi:MAG: hypothetical protein ACLFTQ_00870 [Candidatus Aenigmatarchaeota archaeon]